MADRAQHPDPGRFPVLARADFGCLGSARWRAGDEQLLATLVCLLDDPELSLLWTRHVRLASVEHASARWGRWRCRLLCSGVWMFHGRWRAHRVAFRRSSRAQRIDRVDLGRAGPDSVRGSARLDLVRHSVG